MRGMVKKNRTLDPVFMLTHYRCPVSVSFVATNLPLWSAFDTYATLYQKDRDCFHLLLKHPTFPRTGERLTAAPDAPNTGLLWLEFSSQRVLMTLQGRSQLGYRHHWANGVYGTSRYWLHGETDYLHSSIRLRNFTRRLVVSGYPLPDRIQIEYELWSGDLMLGCYIVHLDLHL